MSSCSRSSPQALLQGVQEMVQSLSELHDLRRRVREAEAEFCKGKAAAPRWFVARRGAPSRGAAALRGCRLTSGRHTLPSQRHHPEKSDALPA